MEQNQKKIVLDYFNKWLSCANEENFNFLFYDEFRNINNEGQNAILDTHKKLVNRFIYKRFRCRPPFDELTKDFIKISQHCLSFALSNEFPISIFAKFQVQQYLKLFKEVCEIPELLDKDLYQYWIYTSKDQFNFELDNYDLMNIFSNQKSQKRKWRL